MSGLRTDISPNLELYPSYYMSPLDADFIDISTPNQPIQPTIITPIVKKEELVKSINYCKILLGFTITIIIILLGYIIYLLYKNMFLGSSLINKYSNILSNFSNKDQVEFKSDNDYDIHYLVEQMIYKEFSPTDKKKYLNLPQALKDSIISDYLISKI
jgi:hypothetical protein